MCMCVSDSVTFCNSKLVFLKDVFASRSKWKSKNIFALKSCKNSNASEDIKKFLSLLNLPSS